MALEDKRDELFQELKRLEEKLTELELLIQKLKGERNGS